MAKVAVVGVGAIGGVVAAMLQVAGHEITLCTRSPLSGLVVETQDGEIAVKAANAVDPAAVGEVDWVVVATKAYDVAGAAKWLERLCARGASAAVFQNGVEHRERFAPYMAAEKILPVMVDCPVERPAPERVVQRGQMYVKVEDTAQGAEFVGLFTGAPADASVTPDFRSAAWRKLCVNSAGVLLALTMQPSGVMRGEALGEISLGIVRECIAVGRAEGAVLGDEIAEEVLQRMRLSPADMINSIYADRLAGRPMEVDARNGVIVRLGERHGIATPLNRMAAALLEAVAV